MGTLKEEKKKMKTYQLTTKEDFIYYLYQLFCRLYKVIKQQERFLNLVHKDIEKYQLNNILKKSEFIDVPYEVYSDALALLGHNETHLLNLVGDMQGSSLSYYKFRDIIKRKKSKKSLGFDIRDIDEEVLSILKELNKARNFQNHEPESLITSERKLIEEGRFAEFSLDPILIVNHEYCTLEYFIDMYNSYKELNILANKILDSMKLDYEDLLGKSVRVIEGVEAKSRGLEHLEPVKLAADVQGI